MTSPARQGYSTCLNEALIRKSGSTVNSIQSGKRHLKNQIATGMSESTKMAG